MRGAENHGWGCFALTEFSGHLESIQARHADIQQHYIRPQAVDQAEGLLTVAGCGFKHAIAIKFAHHTA